MTLEARPWLPANAVRDGALKDALSRHGERWAARWFSTPKPVSVRMNEVSRTAIAGDCQCWRHPASGALLVLAPNAHVALASAMLGTDVSAHKLIAHDHTLLRRLAMRCAEDYLRTAMPSLGFDGVAEDAPSREATAGFRFVISLGAASQLLELYLAGRAAVAARRAVLADPPQPGRPLVSRDDAIGAQPIRVGAMIGTSKLGLGELRSLACGDVLVLDRGPQEALTLAINGVARPDTHCKIVENNGALCMRLDGWDNGRQT